MLSCPRLLWLALSLAFLAGCAGPVSQGTRALDEGRYDQALSRFDEALARHPDDQEALVGRGISQFKLGDYEGAIRTLTGVTAQTPASPSGRLYLGLSYLAKGEDGPADESLAAFLTSRPNPRVAAAVDRVQKLLRSEHLSPEVRAFVVASLDDEVQWARDVRAEAARPYPPTRYFWSPGRCFAGRRGHVICY